MTGNCAVATVIVDEDGDAGGVDGSAGVFDAPTETDGGDAGLPAGEGGVAQPAAKNGMAVSIRRKDFFIYGKGVRRDRGDVGLLEK